MKLTLTAKPFNLNKEQVKWVEDTLKNMSLDDKIKQLFVDMAIAPDPKDIPALVKERKPGGLRYMNKDAKTLQEMIYHYQKNSEIPLMVACNTESGGDGAMAGGTNVGNLTKISATNNKKYAYELGRISGIEARAIGCNTLFAPVVDVNRNWRNPVISLRTFGQDEKKVAEYAKEYIKAAQKEGVACICKHFPGDGIDERDQHLTNSLNNLSCDEWDKIFGHVYKEMIEAGVNGIMIGHILLPAYEKFFNKNIKPEEHMPATLSKYLLQNLLREKLGFNGLIITDASHMVGMTGRMARRDIVPTAIASGCDMFLFYNDYEEDFNYVKDYIKKGLLTEERLNEAVTRILAYKASLKLNEFKPVLDESLLKQINLPESLEVAKEIAKKAITLVKNNNKDVLPLSPKKTKRILLIHHDANNPFTAFVSNSKKEKYYEVFAKLLEKEGFEVEVYTPMLEQLKKATPDELREKMGKLYSSKCPISNLKERADLVIHIANIPGNSVVQRIDFSLIKGGVDIPWYVHELPVIFISVCCPFHLIDVAQVQTYINCYDANNVTIEALTEKLLGKDKFEGVSPVDAFCASEDTKW